MGGGGGGPRPIRLGLINGSPYYSLAASEDNKEGPAGVLGHRHHSILYLAWIFLFVNP